LPASQHCWLKQEAFSLPIETFLERCRQVMRVKHLSYRTEETYLPVIRRFIEFHGGRTHPKDMGAEEVRAFLSYLAVEGRVAASTSERCFQRPPLPLSRRAPP
jgi:Phage integrase, N-terminal SAM-like domain